MSDLQPRWYAVSRGNGNDGVSHIFPDYFVYTAHPFDLAEHDCIQQWKPKWREWAAEAVEVDGEADYTIRATIYEGPNGETQFGAAELIVEVFPVDQPDDDRPTYDGLTAALGTGEGIPAEPPYRAATPRQSARSSNG